MCVRRLATLPYESLHAHHISSLEVHARCQSPRELRSHGYGSGKQDEQLFSSRMVH